MLHKTAALIIAMIFSVGLSAQSIPERIHSVVYLKANNGDKNQLEKGIAEHIKKFHSDGKWPEYVHEVIAGERTGQYFHFSAAHQRPLGHFGRVFSTTTLKKNARNHVLTSE